MKRKPNFELEHPRTYLYIGNFQFAITFKMNNFQHITHKVDLLANLFTKFLTKTSNLQIIKIRER